MVPRLRIASSRLMPMPLSVSLSVRAALSTSMRMAGRHRSPAGRDSRSPRSAACRRRRKRGDQLAQEDFLVAVQRVDHQVQQLLHFRTEAHRFVRCGHGSPLGNLVIPARRRGCGMRNGGKARRAAARACTAGTAAAPVTRQIGPDRRFSSPARAASAPPRANARAGARKRSMPGSALLATLKRIQPEGSCDGENRLPGANRKPSSCPAVAIALVSRPVSAHRYMPACWPGNSFRPRFSRVRRVSSRARSARAHALDVLAVVPFGQHLIERALVDLRRGQAGQQLAVGQRGDQFRCAAMKPTRRLGASVLEKLPVDHPAQLVEAGQPRGALAGGSRSQ